MPFSGNVIYVRPENLDKYWPKIRGKIEAAVDRADGSTTLESIYARAREEICQIWVSEDLKMVCVTEITNYLNGSRYLTFIVLSGVDFNEYKHLENLLLDWSITQGCQGAEIYGRIGWLRRLKDYRPAHVLMRKEYGQQQQAANNDSASRNTGGDEATPD